MATVYSQPENFAPKIRKWPARQLTASPLWCAVDLRDGNQALPHPLSSSQKETYFKLLTHIGIKEIEVGFPAASMDDWSFCRNLIERQLIPDDVTISVLTQAREHIIRRTMAALSGVKKAICHVYVPTSELHLRYVLNESQKEIRKRAIESVCLVRNLARKMTNSHIFLEFSPEEFTDSNLDFVVELCDKVVESWQPEAGEKVIINLPCTVERTLPTHYPDMLEAFKERTRYGANMTISLHTHNDMGCAVAETELGLLAGGERVEGTLFGNGERSGNLDLVTLALNLKCMGIETGLHFEQLEALASQVVELTTIPIAPRQPYAGELVFTAFSGSHQDAIHKGLARASDCEAYFKGWKMPYFQINPRDIGRTFKESIRINSQSGSGGIAHVLSENYGVSLPKELLNELSEIVKQKADQYEAELSPEAVWELFLKEYARQDEPLKLVKYWPRPDVNDPSRIHSEVHLEMNGQCFNLHATGDGPVSAFANALRQLNLPVFKLLHYEEHSMGMTVDAESITIVSLEKIGEGTYYGVGFGANIVQGAARAIISSLNRMIQS